jgi:hypothetical protein
MVRRVTPVRRVDLTRAYLTLRRAFPATAATMMQVSRAKKVRQRTRPYHRPTPPTHSSRHSSMSGVGNKEPFAMVCPGVAYFVHRLDRPPGERQGLPASHKRPVCRRPGNQVVADWVCAGLDILGLVCVGVTASPCAVIESLVSVTRCGSGTLLPSAFISFDST